MTDLQIEKFQSLYLKRYGTSLNKEDAYEKGLTLVRMIRTVLPTTDNKDVGTKLKLNKERNHDSKKT